MRDSKHTAKKVPLSLALSLFPRARCFTAKKVPFLSPSRSLSPLSCSLSLSLSVSLSLLSLSPSPSLSPPWVDRIVTDPESAGSVCARVTDRVHAVLRGSLALSE